MRNTLKVALLAGVSVVALAGQAMADCPSGYTSGYGYDWSTGTAVPACYTTGTFGGNVSTTGEFKDSPWTAPDENGDEQHLTMYDYQGTGVYGQNGTAVGNGAFVARHVPESGTPGEPDYVSEHWEPVNNGTAIGAHASVQHEHSTALGADSASTTDHQVMLGTGEDTITAPGVTTQKSLDRQVGSVHLVTTDSQGNLSHDGGYVFDTLVSHGTRLDAVEAKNGEQDGRLNSVEAKNGEQDGRLDSVEAKNGEQDGRLTSVEGKNGEQDGRLTSVEGKNGEQDGRLTSVEGKNVEQDGRLNSVEAKNTEQDGKLANHETRITKNTSDIATHETRITNTEAKNTEQDGKLANHETRITKNTTDIASTNTRLNEFNGTGGSVESWATSVDTLNYNQNNRLNNIDSHLGVLDKKMEKAYEGVAMALAMESPQVDQGKKFGLSVNWGTFEGENAFAAAGKIRFDNTWSGTAGIGVGTAGTVGGRAGIQAQW
jgi:hypothetical protein